MALQQLLRMGLPVIAAIALAAPPAPAATILKKEPDMGKLKFGQVVLVDDGKCPPGQVREVTGGDHVKVGGKRQFERTYRCVPRP